MQSIKFTALRPDAPCAAAPCQGHCTHMPSAQHMQGMLHTQNGIPLQPQETIIPDIEFVDSLIVFSRCSITIVPCPRSVTSCPPCIIVMIPLGTVPRARPTSHRCFPPCRGINIEHGQIFAPFPSLPNLSSSRSFSASIAILCPSLHDRRSPFSSSSQNSHLHTHERA